MVVGKQRRLTVMRDLRNLPEERISLQRERDPTSEIGSSDNAVGVDAHDKSEGDYPANQLKRSH